MHNLLQLFIQAWTSFCPADYTGLIWNACSQHQSNVIFNHCTASIIAAGIGLVGDTIYGAGWGHHSSGSHTHSSGTSSSGSSATHDSGTPHTPSPNFDSVLYDNLPEEMGGHYQLSDLADLLGSSSSAGN